MRKPKLRLFPIPEIPAKGGRKLDSKGKGKKPCFRAAQRANKGRNLGEEETKPKLRPFPPTLQRKAEKKTFVWCAEANNKEAQQAERAFDELRLSP